MTKQITLFLCFLTISWSIEAQQTVTGQVTNRENGDPIPETSVFIAHSTISTYTDSLGFFSITTPIQGSFMIVVSHLGFHSASRTIDSPQTTHHINIALQENLLQEVVIDPCLPMRSRDETLFWREILGERPSNSGMQILNREVVRFCLTNIGILRVFADEPIEIINHHLGYRISYVLDRFEHNYNTGDTRITGMPFFTELTPSNERQRTNWERRRQTAYAVSFTRFIRVLYQEQLNEKGFLLVKVDPQDNSRWTALTRTQGRDERSAFERNLFPERSTQNITTPFSYEHVLQRDDESTVFTIQQLTMLAFIGSSVTNVMAEDLRELLFGRGATFPIVQFTPFNITIFPDGSFSGMLRIQDIRESVLSLNALLPMEFGADRSIEILNAPLRRR